MSNGHAQFWFTLICLLFANAALGGNVILTSDVSVNLSAEPSTNLQPGEPIRLTITVTNNGPVALEDFGVDSSNIPPDQIDVLNPDTDCLDSVLGILDGATTFWYIVTWYPTDTSSQTPRNWPLAVGESRSCHMTVRLLETSAQTVPLDFHLATYWSDLNPSNDVGRVTLQRAVAAVTPIPAGSPESLASIAFFLLLLGLATLARRRLTHPRAC